MAIVPSIGQPINYTVDAGYNPIQTGIANRGQLIINAANQQKTEQQKSLWEDQTRFRDMYSAAGNILSNPNKESQDRMIQARIAEGEAAGKDMSESRDFLNMPVEQRQQVYNQMGQLGQRLGFIEAAPAYSGTKEAFDAEQQRLKDNAEYNKLSDAEKLKLQKQELSDNAQYRAGMLSNAAEQNQLTAESRDAQRALTEQLRTNSLNEQKDRRTESDVQKLQKDITKNNATISPLKEVENIIGGDLNTYDYTTNTINGKPIKDLPGIQPVGGFGPRVYAPGEGQRFKSAVAKVFNITLKDRSGAAVTTPEMDRLKEEFAMGTYQTDAELMDALKRFKEQLKLSMQDIEAGYRPDVVETYKSRGGRGSETLGSPQTTAQPVDLKSILGD